MVDVLVPTQAVPSLLGRYMRGWVCHTDIFSGEVLLLVFDLNAELLYVRRHFLSVCSRPLSCINLGRICSACIKGEVRLGVASKAVLANL